jgi:hypothetical protein
MVDPTIQSYWLGVGCGVMAGSCVALFIILWAHGFVSLIDAIRNGERTERLLLERHDAFLALRMRASGTNQQRGVPSGR